MTQIEDLLALMQQKITQIKFKDLVKVCDYYFGKPRQNGTSHRINIQKSGKDAKAYKVKQVLIAINKLMEQKNEK